MSASFAALGFILSITLFFTTRNTKLAIGIFYFFLMEFLQAIQYLYIANDLNSPICDTDVNKILTLLGYAHICFQPYFCWLTVESLLLRNPKHRERFATIKSLCLIGCFWLLSRYMLSSLPGYDTLTGTSTEWLRGSKLCTFKGKFHLSWSVPMADATYFVPGVAIHSFLMFAPFLTLWDVKGSLFMGTLLFLTGPIMASWISPSLMEQASIWCFFSIAQIAGFLVTHFILGITLQPEDIQKSK
jgi:hypothetical protein